MQAEVHKEDEVGAYLLSFRELIALSSLLVSRTVCHHCSLSVSTVTSSFFILFDLNMYNF